MGWLGWTEEQTLDTSMPAIALAHEGRLDMLQALFGGDKPAAEPAEAEGPASDPDVGDRLKFALRSLAAPRKPGTGRA